LPSNDSCPTGQYCAATACAPGCKTNLDCVALADAGANDAASDAAGDAATEGGGGTGTGGGTTCDTTNHVCVECLVDSNCPLGETCSNDTCVVGCDATHGCPAGSGCCTGLCQPLNTIGNCTGCGIACDTTSGNSQGAACGPGGCTYTGCAA
jgi:Cys-rich repeat protein